MPIFISHRITLADHEVEFTSVKASGPGGQHVNTASTAIHLRFDIHRSSLPDDLKTRLLERSDHRITESGVIVIKSKEHRSREMNRQAAIERLVAFIRQAQVIPKKRRPTRPTRSAKEKRLKAKAKRSETKSMRKKISH
ncbi:MAG: aminoacyl-tRNA hydrolase [Desulfobacterales bacterium]|nr:aminoacyl-tRNA hydrolase [Desulfobacterales bacterium]